MSRLDGPLSALRQLGRRRAAAGAVVLGYHDVVDPSATPADALSVDPSLLAAHLDTLQRLGLTIRPLGELVDRLERGDDVDGLAAITFDDALVGVHRQALAVLDAAGVSATVFVVADHLGVPPPWWPGSQRTMTETELREVAAAGHSIGSHTATHGSLPTATAADLERELVTSRHTLEAITGTPVDTLAYPSGHHDRAVRDAASAAGYRAAFTFLNGRILGGEDPWMLPRLTMGTHASPRRLAYHLLRSAGSWPDHQIEVPGDGPRP